MLSSIEHTKTPDVAFDLEFEMSGEQFEELNWEKLRKLKEDNHEVAIAIEKTLMNNFWEIISLEELKTQLHKNLSFLDLVKIKLDFGEKGYQPKSCYHQGISLAFNAIENLPNILTNKLFGWIYYKDKKDKLSTFRFSINIDTGAIKYFD